jgi:hypothetical protein
VKGLRTWNTRISVRRSGRPRSYSFRQDGILLSKARHEGGTPSLLVTCMVMRPGLRWDREWLT